MKFLVVDDDPAKRDAIEQELVAHGVAYEDVVHASTVVAARTLLNSESFDVMFLDILLPVREGGMPSAQNSLELIKEIVDDGSATAPKYIVGMTADLTAMDAHAPEFRQLTFNAILVAPGHSEWRVFVQNLISFLARLENGPGTHDVDVCVLCALRFPELDAAINAWEAEVGEDEILCSSVLYKKGSCNVGGARRSIVFAWPSQMGPVAATQATTQLLTTFRPRLMLMTGICGGIDGELNLGDVIVADKSWDWQSGKWTGEGALLAAPDQRDADGKLLAYTRMISSGDLAAMQRKFQGNVPSTQLRIRIGPMVTGSSVVASSDAQAVFRTQHRKMAGVDMECYGVYYAAEVNAGPATRVLCAKGVSDLADRAKSDEFQRYCSYMSAYVALDVAERYFRMA